MKQIIIASAIGFLVAFGLISAVGQVKPGLGGGLVNSSVVKNSALTSSSDQVGPDENVQVVATTTGRHYLRLAHNGGGSDIYCNANNDITASDGNGFKLASTTDTAIVLSGPTGIRYTGAVRCTATASTTLLIVEY